MAASGCGYDSLSLRRFRFCPGCVDEGELWSASRGKRWFPHGGGWNPKSQSKMDEHPKMNGIFTRVAQCFWAIPKCLLVAGWLKHHTFQGLLSWITRIYPGQNNQLPLGTIPSAQTWVFFFNCLLIVLFWGLKPETSQSHESWDISSMYVSDHPVYIIPVVSHPHVVCVWKIPL